MKHRLTIQEATRIDEEIRSLKCLTCDAVTEHDASRYCLSCGMYWKDVSEGLFDQHDDYM